MRRLPGCIPSERFLTFSSLVEDRRSRVDPTNLTWSTSPASDLRFTSGNLIPSLSKIGNPLEGKESVILIH